MAKEETPPVYPCMVPPGDLRRVHEPHDERVVAASRGRIRRVLAKLRSSART